MPRVLWDRDTPASHGSRGKRPHSQIPGSLSQRDEPRRRRWVCPCPRIPWEWLNPGNFGCSHPKIHPPRQSRPIPLILGFEGRPKFLGALGIFCLLLWGRKRAGTHRWPGEGDGIPGILGKIQWDEHGGKIHLLPFPGSSPGAWKARLQIPEVSWCSLGIPRSNQFPVLHLPSSQISCIQNPLG